MSKDKPEKVKIQTFPDHYVITPPNPLRKHLHRVLEKDADDPVARAESALAELSGEFKNWMASETDRLTTAYAEIRRDGFNEENQQELFRAAHDVKGDAATFGYPSAATVADSLCRILEHAPDIDVVPPELIEHHIKAIEAIVNERTQLDSVKTANELSRKLRSVAHEYLVFVNRDRPEHLEAIMAPSIVPGDDK
jgi:chemotaxis protein histidine kinase CheA